MQYMLTAKIGYTPGVTWHIGDQPLVLGRAAECDIVLDDATISRRHCQVARGPLGPVLTDLGGRNPVLINGEPCTEALLRLGDELTVGGVGFLITATSVDATMVDAVSENSDTVAIQLDDLALFSKVQTGAAEGLWLGSVADYVRLFAFSRRLSLATGVGGIHACFSDFLHDRMSAQDVALIRRTGDGWTPWSPASRAMSSANARAFANVIDSRSAIASPLDKTRPDTLQLVAPLRWKDDDLGVATAVHGANPDEIRGDLAVFAAAAELLGPYLHAADRLERVTAAARRLDSDEYGDPPLIGRSPAMAILRSRIAELAASPMHALILGESGTGKELIARNIHNASSRKCAPYIVLNCAAIPDNLFESELFGHVAGAFTGAVGKKQGLLELANKGTLFLDEIGDLAPENQAKFLRAVEQGTFRPLGGTEERRVDVRFLAATNMRLEEDAFRRDLYHRLAGWVIEAPALRDHPEDIPLLVQQMIDVMTAEHAHLNCTVSEEALDELRARPWPGNVRELRNVVEHALHRCRGGEMQRHHLAQHVSAFAHGQPARFEPCTLAETERKHIEQVLRHCRGNMSKAARTLGISRSTLYLKVDEFKIKHV